jgi:hypothetical protein
MQASTGVTAGTDHKPRHTGEGLHQGCNRKRDCLVSTSVAGGGPLPAIRISAASAVRGYAAHQRGLTHKTNTKGAAHRGKPPWILLLTVRKSYSFLCYLSFLPFLTSPKTLMLIDPRDWFVQPSFTLIV